MNDVQDQFGSNFANFGVASKTQELQQFIQTKGAWSDFFVGSTGQTVLEAMATIQAKENFKLIRGIQESYPHRAKLRTSVLEGLKFYNFDPKRRTMASVDLRFFIDSPIGNDIVIPRKTQVTAPESGIKFFTTKKVVLPAGQSEVTVEANQAEIKTEQQVSQGAEGQEIAIPSDIVAEDGIEVFVGGDRWEVIDSLLRSLRDSDDFEAVEIRSLPDETLVVEFGDGVQGKIPPAGETIRVDYFETRGAEGTVVGTDAITSIDTTITDIAGNDVSDQMNVTNDSRKATGGSSKQSIEEMLLLAPRLLKTGGAEEDRGKAVSREDYNAIARNYPSVLLANAVGERHANPPNPDYSDLVDIFIVRERDQNGVPQPVNDDWAFGSSLKASPENPDPGTFLDFFNEKSDLDTTNIAKPADLVWFFVEGEITIDPSLEPSVKRQEVQEALKQFLLVENNVNRNIGRDLRESVVRDQIVTQVDQIEYHHIKLIEFAKTVVDSTNLTLTLDDFSASGIDYHLRPPFARHTIKIFDTSGNLVAEDDGDGNLIPGPNETNFQSGTVDYRIPADPDQWELTMQFSSVPNEVLDFQFQTGDPRDPDSTLRDGDILTNPNQFAIYRPTKTDISVRFVG